MVFIFLAHFIKHTIAHDILLHATLKQESQSNQKDLLLKSTTPPYPLELYFHFSVYLMHVKSQTSQ